MSNFFLGIGKRVKRLRFASLLVMFRNAFHHMGIPEWLGPHLCLRPLSARASGMTGKTVQGVWVSAEQSFFPSPLFCHHVGFQQANCADLQLGLPVVTDCGPPAVLGPIHSVCFRWNCADNFGAVSEGATLTDRCLDRLFLIRSVAQVSPCTR